MGLSNCYMICDTEKLEIVVILKEQNNPRDAIRDRTQSSKVQNFE